MKSLIWKECRANPWLLALGIVLGFGPYVVGILWLLFGFGARVDAGMRLAFMLEPATVISIEATLLTLLLFGANSIASERADRSAEFLAYLPIRRVTILTSKLVVPLAIASAVWGLSLVANELAPAVTAGKVSGTKPIGLERMIFAASVLFFGSAWLGSSMAEKPMTAVGFSLGISMVLSLAFGACNQLTGWPASTFGNEGAINVYAAAMCIAGVTCFLSGSRLYLRRVEP
jgi:ABC-type transport system involved in multi-copper enzyme maturation permease subunit